MSGEEIVAAHRVAARMAAAIQLEAIILRELDWSVPEIPVPPGLPIQMAPEISAEFGQTESHFVYKIHATISGRIPDQTEIFRLRCQYQTVFRYPEGMDFTSDEIEAFGSTSVMLIVFPYLRETLQSTAAKGGLPGVLLQSLKIPMAGTEEAESVLAGSGLDESATV
jgi:preprotein translocase subunit SecB